MHSPSDNVLMDYNEYENGHTASLSQLYSRSECNDIQARLASRVLSIGNPSSVRFINDDSQQPNRMSSTKGSVDDKK